MLLRINTGIVALREGLKHSIYVFSIGHCSAELTRAACLIPALLDSTERRASGSPPREVGSQTALVPDEKFAQIGNPDRDVGDTAVGGGESIDGSWGWRDPWPGVATSGRSEGAQAAPPAAPRTRLGRRQRQRDPGCASRRPIDGLGLINCSRLISRERIEGGVGGQRFPASFSGLQITAPCTGRMTVWHMRLR